MVSRYEALLLTVPEITADELKNIETHVDRLIKGAKGTVISFEKWGKYRLSYPVRKNDYGVYVLIRFEAPTSTVEEAKSLFAVKFFELIMRHMIIQLAPNQSLAYQKPASLEDAPVRDVGTFLKENKMEGLMSAAGVETEEFEEEDEA